MADGDSAANHNGTSLDTPSNSEVSKDLSRLTIEFETVNEAFSNTPVLEVNRILNRICAATQAGYHGGSIIDINGNKIGEWQWQ